MKLLEKTITELFKERVKEYPGKVFMEYFGDIYTYEKTDIYSDIVMEKLSFLGVKKGDRVAIWSENSPVWVIYFLALQKLKALPVLINTSYKQEELEKVLLATRVSHVIHGTGHKDVNYKDVLFSIRLKGEVKIKNYIELPGSLDFNTVGREVSDFNETESPFSPAVIMFTSGSTRIPKGVLLSHHSLINNACSIAKEMEWEKSERLCLSVPLFHCFGLTAGFLSMLCVGGTLNILNVFRTKSVLECIERNRCSILNGVPSMFISIVNNDILKDYDISSLTSGIIAGAPVTPGEYMNISSKLGIEHLEQSYGQTETSPMITMTSKKASRREKAASAGHVCPFQEVRIVSQKTGEILPINKTGEIEVRGYNVMLGYDGLKKETNEVLSEDGWLKTGDLGFFCEKNNLHVTGRKNEIIIRGGENISPLEIEETIMNIEEVKEVKVLSVPDLVMTEEIAVALTTINPQKIKSEFIKKYVKDRMAGFKVPKYVLIFDELPKLENGKIDSIRLKGEFIKKFNIRLKE